MPDVGMPRLSDSMYEGAVSVWLVEDGSAVTRGQEILEVETDKATMTYEAEHAGILRILVTEGVNVPVGQVIATIGDSERRSAPPVTRRSDLSPLLRRLAREHGVDVETLRGTGPGGKVQRADIIAAGTAPAAAASTPPDEVAPGGDRRFPLSRSQRLVATRLTESQRTIPDFWATISVDVTRLLELRQDLKAASPGQSGASVVPTVNDFIVRACALGLAEHPGVNAHYYDDHVVAASAVNVGVAVSTDTGLLVPVVKDADRLPIGEIARETRSLADLARAGKIGLAQLEGATFTVSSLGAFGVRSFAPILSGSQAAILGVGAATPTCVPIDGLVTVRSLVELTLTSDHRIVYGVAAARFLQTLKALLEAPGQLLAPPAP